MIKHYLPKLLYDEACAVNYRGRLAFLQHSQHISFHCVGPPFPSEELSGKLRDTVGGVYHEAVTQR